MKQYLKGKKHQISREKVKHERERDLIRDVKALLHLNVYSKNLINIQSSSSSLNLQSNVTQMISKKWTELSQYMFLFQYQSIKWLKEV